MSMRPASPERLPVRFRRAALTDLDAILQVEQSWHEQGRASADKFISRLTRFPNGFFVGCLNEDGRERIVATVTSMPTCFDPNDPAAFKNWNTVTNHGYLPEDVRPDSCNALYIVSGVIDRDYRGRHIFEAGVMAQVQLARSLGLHYVVAGAVIPGYRKYCEKHGHTDAYHYCIARHGAHLIDPLLAMYETIGFSIMSRRHVIAEYFPDDASNNHAALVTRDLRSG